MPVQNRPQTRAQEGGKSVVADSWLKKRALAEALGYSTRFIERQMAAGAPYRRLPDGRMEGRLSEWRNWIEQRERRRRGQIISMRDGFGARIQLFSLAAFAFRLRLTRNVTSLCGSINRRLSCVLRREDPGTTERLIGHHVDQDRSNNVPENIQIL